MSESNQFNGNVRDAIQNFVIFIIETSFIFQPLQPPHPNDTP